MKPWDEMKVGENFVVPLKDGERIECTKLSNNSFSFNLPAESTRRQCDPLDRYMGKCDFGEAVDKCQQKPWNCSHRIESWMQEQDRMEAKIFNIKPTQRDLSFLKARLELRCQARHNPSGRRLTWKHNKARILAAIEEENRKEQAVKLIRDRRRAQEPVASRSASITFGKYLR